MNDLFKDTPYSETVGSFIRTGNYPLEANYIFPTEEALKEFYSDEVNVTTIHKGLLKIVENDGTGKLALYWVTKKQTNDELEFTKLISGTNIDSIFAQLVDLETRLTDEIKNRKDSETAIWGTNDPTNVPEELNSLLDLANVVIAIKEEITKIHKELIDSDDSIYKSLKTEVKTLAGTQEYDVVEYLKTLPYKSLTEVANALNKFLNEVDATSNQINTLPELKFFLEGYNDKQKLRHVLLDLQAEILGNPLPTQDFRTLRAVEDFVRILKADSENSDKNLQSELNQTQVGVGLNADGSYSADQETYYLKDATSIMNALKILDSLMYEAISGITIEPENKDVVDLAVRKELEGYIVSAKLKLSNQLGNDLIKKEDGLYFNVDSTYKDGKLTILVNGKVIAQHILGFSSLVDTAKYDPTQEAIVIVFKLLSGEKQTVTIPVGALIREWEVDNAQPGKVVELERTVVIDGADTLSADVRLWADKNNILKKYGNTLGVEGTTDNITHNSETLKVFLDALKNTVIANNTALNNKIDSEIARATAKEALIEESVSQTKTDINAAIEEVKDDIVDTNNALRTEANRATAAENALKTLVDDLKTATSELRQNTEANTTRVNALDSNLKLQKQELIHEIHLVSDEVDDKIASKAEKSDLNTLSVKVETLSDKVDSAVKKTDEFANAISKNKDDIKDLEQTIKKVEEDVKNVSTENFYTKKETQDMLDNKADLVNGKISPDQMSFYIIEVE